MRLNLQLTKAFFLSVLALAGLLAIAQLIHWDRVVGFDSWVIDLVNGWHSDLATQVMVLFTTIGDAATVAAISLTALFLLYHLGSSRMELALFLAVVISSGVFNFLLKNVFQRVRPELNPLVHADGFSYPSGHSMSAFALYGILGFLIWLKVENKLWRTALLLVCIAMVLLIGTSRIYLGVHYPSDVVGGFLGGASLLTFAVWYYQQKKTEAS
ncbi:undecaprenyl-diphosphatase [Tumebacillus sp. BK434]|uniref:phosphatase PAP2 family protein n=1 Tax=Tumebacillus sp. BK434 TaxID=2512169 RepID=UPI00104FB85C|nr:phosphatase PAP2 family protein [Tumebacillus sp. BK434]TCP55964.1 undecaprenyl-diphosphatase [Tumebacillus sp. BK434]